MMPDDSLAVLTQTVQRNCHISDARHAADYTLCIYLMKMREYYRWEKGLAFSVSLPKNAVGSWLVERERLWDSLEQAKFEPLTIDDTRFDPFDAQPINLALARQGLVYSGGLGHNAKPHFFLGGLERRQDFAGVSVLVASEEYARDLAAPPAMSSDDGTVFVRRESLRRMLWEKLESWRWSRPDNALGRAFACYDFENRLEASLDAMTERELETVVLHEIGECKAGHLLGDTWNEMLLGLCGAPAELMARAVRDHIADCQTTLPRLAQEGDAASIHFYVGNLNHMRRQIFPALETSYRQWLATGDPGSLEAIAGKGRKHWFGLAAEMMETFRRLPEQAARPIQQLVENNYL